MRSCSLLLLALAGPMMLGADIAAQKLSRSSLDHSLATALKTNPDILMAAAKVQQAQAELRAIRLRVTQQVVEAYGAWQGQRILLEMRTEDFKLANRQHGSGMVTAESVRESEYELIVAQNEFTRIESELRYLLGIGGGKTVAEPASDAPLRRRYPVPEAFEAYMHLEVDVNFESTPLPEVVQALAMVVDQASAKPDFKFVLDEQMLTDELGPLEEITLTLTKGRMELQHALLMITDVIPVQFVFRDYGVLVSTSSRVQDIDAAAIPRDARLRRRR